MPTVAVTDAVAGRLYVSRDVLRWDAVLLLSMGRAYHYGRLLLGLLDAERSISPRRAALGFLHDSCFLRFVMDWCKVFGRKEEKVHWVKLFSTTGVKRNVKVERFKRRVTHALVVYSGIPADGFAPCREAMLRARDRLAAHLDAGRVPDLPFLEPAYRIADALSRILAQQKEIAFSALSARERADEEEFFGAIGKGMPGRPSPGEEE